VIKLPPAANGTNNLFKQRLSFLQPLAPIVLFYLFGLFIFTFFRFLLCAEYFSRLQEVKNYFRIIPIGFRLDTILLCNVLILPFLAVVFLPRTVMAKICWIFSLYFAALASVFAFLEIATFPFMEEFDTRLDRIFLEHMVQVREVFGMILKGHRVSLTCGLLAVVLISLSVYGCSQKLFQQAKECSMKQRLLVLVAGGILLTIGARSTFIKHPANINLASFSSSHLANQLALNSTYSLAYAFYANLKMETDPRKLYGDMDSADMLSQIRASEGISAESCRNPDIPLLHYQQSRFSPERPANLVIILEESLGSEYVGCLGGLPLTPNIDRLSKEGMLLTNLYCTGIRTIRGIEAIISGFLPTAGESTIKLGLSQKNFFTIAELLRRKGYATDFIYGGRQSFDSMSGFFLGNGIQEIYDRGDIKSPLFTAAWGVSDEDLFKKANEVFTKKGDTPFFALVLTTSNHDPYDFPDGRIELYEQTKKTRYNAVKYADYAVGKFFEAAKKEAYYKNTLFLIIGDHSTRLQGQDLIPVHKFHIAGLLIGPNVKPGAYDKVASQIDMTPTLLDLMGISTEHPVAGRALLSLPDTIKGRAIMQYGDTNAFMEDNRVVLLQQHRKPAQFVYAEGRLNPAELDPELAKNALAHALLPWYLYCNQLHHVPAEARENK
jgi:phosphoglycerol transferase MdoB-like AlkP superfamily enzyme